MDLKSIISPLSGILISILSAALAAYIAVDRFRVRQEEKNKVQAEKNSELKAAQVRLEVEMKEAVRDQKDALRVAVQEQSISFEKTMGRFEQTLGHLTEELRAQSKVIARFTEIVTQIQIENTRLQEGQRDHEGRIRLTERKA